MREIARSSIFEGRPCNDTEEGEGLGVISGAWNLDGTPMIYVIDHKGIIRYRRMGIPDKQAVDEVLDTLIKEAEKDQKEK